METQSRSGETNPQADDVGRLPYPLTRGRLELWLRRGEQLGRAACWVAATVASWRQHVASKGPIDSPPQPG